MQEKTNLSFEKIVNSTNWENVEEAKSTSLKIAELYKMTYGKGVVRSHSERLNLLNTLSKWCEDAYNSCFNSGNKLHGWTFWTNFQAIPLFEDVIASNCQQGVVAPYIIRACNERIRETQNNEIADICVKMIFKNLKMLYSNIIPQGISYTMQDDPDYFRDLVARESLKEAILKYDFEVYAERHPIGAEPLLNAFTKIIAILEKSTKGNQRRAMANCCERIITLFKLDKNLEDKFRQLQLKYLTTN